jgi:prophage antirepressor-like protein
MSKMELFQNAEFGKIRAMEREGEIWFVAKDVCNILELSDVSMSLSRLSEKQKLIQTVFVSGQNRNIWTINESGLYKLAFTSRKKEAEKFTDWVTEEVLPSIRKHGHYSDKKMTNLDMFEMAVKALREAEIRQRKQEEELYKQKNDIRILNARINNFDKLNVENKRQKLVRMVNKYSYNNGINMQKAWGEFTRYYNNAFHTNLSRLINSYKEKNNMKKLSRPEYLEKTGSLDDALRVIDAMLNKKEG